METEATRQLADWQWLLLAGLPADAYGAWSWKLPPVDKTSLLFSLMVHMWPKL